MAFDRTDPADLASLKTEITTDPLSIGYNLNGAVSRITFLLNDGESNNGGETVGRTFDVEAMRDALDPNDLDAQQTNAKAAEYTHILAEFAAYITIEPCKDKWASMFAANSATVTALNAQTRRRSRAEVLFGNDTILTDIDVATARDS